MSQSCSCSVPPGATYSHCRRCCDSFQTVDLFDMHRESGKCTYLGVRSDAPYERDEKGVWDTPLNIAKRKAFGERVRGLKGS